MEGQSPRHVLPASVTARGTALPRPHNCTPTAGPRASAQSSPFTAQPCCGFLVNLSVCVFSAKLFFGPIRSLCSPCSSQAVNWQFLIQMSAMGNTDLANFVFARAISQPRASPQTPLTLLGWCSKKRGWGGTWKKSNCVHAEFRFPAVLLCSVPFSARMNREENQNKMYLLCFFLLHKVMFS